MNRCGFLVTLDRSTHLCYYDGFNIFIEFDNHIQVLHGIPSEYINTDIKLSEIELYSEYISKRTTEVDYLCIHCGLNKWVTCVGDLINADNYSIVEFTSGDTTAIELPVLSTSVYRRGTRKFNSFMANVV